GGHREGAGGAARRRLGREDRPCLRARARRRRRCRRQARFAPGRGPCMGQGRQDAGRRGDLGQRRRPPPRLVKVAYYSPFPPERTGIADYSALLLPALRERVQVEVVRRGRRRAPRDVDVALYHLGNNPVAHAWILAALRRRRGVVVLHDFVLHHLIAGLTVGRGDATGYLDAMQRDAGVLGRLIGHGFIDG